MHTTFELCVCRCILSADSGHFECVCALAIASSAQSVNLTGVQCVPPLPGVLSSPTLSAVFYKRENQKS